MRNMPSLRVLLLIIILLIVLCLSYRQLNTIKQHSTYEGFSTSTCVVYELHPAAGMFSDMFFLLESYIRANRAKHDFYVDSSKWSYKYKDGWHDYFSSLLEKPNDIEQRYNTIIVCSHRQVNKSIDSDGKICIRDYVDNIKHIFTLNDRIVNICEAKRKEYGGDYEAIYIRRGDKMTPGESPFTQVNDIIKQIQFEEGTPLFVQTDDYTEVVNIRSVLPHKRLLHIVPDTRKGAYESDRQGADADKKRTDTEEFLLGVYLCTHAKKCWVDIYSNVSRFIKIYAFDTVDFYKHNTETIIFDLDTVGFLSHSEYFVRN